MIYTNDIINRVKAAVYSRLYEARRKKTDSDELPSTVAVAGHYNFTTPEGHGRRSVGQQMAETMSDALRYKIRAEYLKLYDEGSPEIRLATMPSKNDKGFLPQLAKNVILFQESTSFRWAVNTYITGRKELAEKAVDLLCEYYMSFLGIRIQMNLLNKTYRQDSKDFDDRMWKIAKGTVLPEFKTAVDNIIRNQFSTDIQKDMHHSLEEWWKDVGYLSMKPAFLMFKTEWNKNLYLKYFKAATDKGLSHEEAEREAAERLRNEIKDNRPYGKAITSSGGVEKETVKHHYNTTYYHPLYNGREFLDFVTPGTAEDGDRTFKYYNPDYLTKDLPDDSKSQAIKLPNFKTLLKADRVFYGKQGARFKNDQEDTARRDKTSVDNKELYTNDEFYDKKYAPFLTDYSQDWRQGQTVRDMIAGLDPTYDSGEKGEYEEPAPRKKGSEALMKKLFALKQAQAQTKAQRGKDDLEKVADQISDLKQQKDAEKKAVYHDSAQDISVMDPNDDSFLDTDFL